MKLKKKFVLYVLFAVILANGIIKTTDLAVAGYTKSVNFIKNPLGEWELATVSYSKPVELSIRDYVKQEVENAGLKWAEVDCLIQHESEWDNWAYGINNDGSTDFGLWQINSVHKLTASVACRWDYKCATRWSINKRLNDGNWHAWYGYLKHCR